ncbi:MULTISPECIES: hypothetical protein [Aphanothece]|uniref:hypothetical protein n=1 Tax=Aphanothece TaxID=1121 RepID=UPI0039854E43
MFNVGLPEEVKKRLGLMYSEKCTVLEYGSGGSTLLALQANPENFCYSCETDPAWLCRLAMEIARLGLSERFYPVFLDIGPTAKWGKPDFATQPYNKQRGKGMIQASLGPWKLLRERQVDPDIVLIDGRFRVASFVASCIYTRKPTRIVFDDYADRPHYHLAERLASPTEIVGRAAFFDIQPTEYDSAHILSLYADFFVDPS